MCGLFAIFLQRRLEPGDIERARRCRDLLAHRGPDSAGEWIDFEQGVYLGHRRLSIIDLSPASDQPFSDGARHLIYNGEIYNYRDIRASLEHKGVDFRTSGDTETLFAALSTWGEAALDRLDGMFSFAFWDGRRATIAIDPFGEKPLYMASFSDGVAIASELAALAPYADRAGSLDEGSSAAYFALGYIPTPHTVHANVQKMPPASLATIEGGTLSAVRSYWRPSAGIPAAGEVPRLGEIDLNRIRDCLIESLERRLISDAPLSLFLSSGTDSALVAALVSRELGRKVDTITVAISPGSALDESAEAARIASHLDLPHEIVAGKEKAAPLTPDRLLDLFGEPNDGISAESVRLIASAVRGRSKAVLSGMGGDELFLGYTKYTTAWRYRRVYAMPSHLRGVVSAATSVWPRMAHLRDLAFVAPEERYIAMKSFPTIRWLRNLPGFGQWALNHFGDESETPFVDFAEYGLRQGIADEHLHRYDLATMRESVELRTPFLTRPLADLMATYDPRSLVAFGQKSVLKALLARYLPNTLFDGPKRGFTYPAEAFVRAYGSSCPSPPGLNPELVREAWSRRFSAYGWTRLAVRLIAADHYFRSTVRGLA